MLPNLLLNVGPKPDGTISEKDQEILRTVGAWMRVNGEAIRDTGLWRVTGEGPTRTAEGQFEDGKPVDWTAEDFRFLCRGSHIYAINMVCPADGVVRIRSLRHSGETGHLPLFHGIVEEVRVLGCDAKVTWRRTEAALEVELGGWRSDLPVVVRVQVK